MAGILNPKSRIMDLIMTQEGKRQLAAGDFKVRYASFTDRGTYYDQTSVTGSYDSAVERPLFEASNLPFDSITIEANDHGNVLAVGVNVNNDGNRILIADGKISTAKDGSPFLNDANTDSRFASLVDEIIGNTTANFKKQSIIASRDPVDNSDQFVVSTNDVNFQYSNKGPIPGEDLVPSINQAPSLFTHKRFSNSLNFSYLPPVVKVNDKPQVMGDYPNVKDADSYTYEELVTDLVGNDPENPRCPNQTIRFVETSQTNDIAFQAFELGSSTVKKLDMVDFGEFNVADDIDHPTKRVVFLGKVFVDSYGSTTYANIFTIILD